MLTSMECGFEPIIAYRGSLFTIEFAVRTDGSVPAHTFFTGLDARWQARFLVLFKNLGDMGRIRSREQFRKFSGEFFEFKAFQNRMPCYYRPDRRVVITHGFIKKQDAAPKQEVDRAVTIKNEHDGRLASSGRCRR